MGLGVFGSAALATALAFATVFTHAAVVTGLATAFALTAVLAFAAVLVRIGVGEHLAFVHAGLIGSAAARGRGLDARERTGQQAGNCNRREHGLAGLEETWIFHEGTGLSCFQLLG